MNGYLEVFKWLHLNRSEGYTQNATNDGHPDIVEWMRLHSIDT
jgi:hypothetical protein